MRSEPHPGNEDGMMQPGSCAHCGQFHSTAVCPPASAGKPDDIVGHKTFRDGQGGFRHEPLTRAEGEAIWAAAEAEREKRQADMPDEQTALNVMGSAFQRLRELGWREAIYCPKDGTSLQIIEPGSTGIHRAHYHGEWPKGTWWVEDDGDLWPSRPCLFKLYPEDQAKEDARMAEAAARYRSQTETKT